MVLEGQGLYDLPAVRRSGQGGRLSLRDHSGQLVETLPDPAPAISSADCYLSPVEEQEVLYPQLSHHGLV